MKPLLEHAKAAIANIRRSAVTKLNAGATFVGAVAAYYQPQSLPLMGYLPPRAQHFAPALLVAWFGIVQWSAHRDAKKAAAEAEIRARVQQAVGNG